MKKLVGTLVSVHTGNNPDYSKDVQPSARMELDGFVGDKHRSFERIAQSYDPDPTGTVRRNERQWSGVSNEELAIIAERLDLKEPLMAATAGANVCVEGIPEFSKLPKGSRLLFPSGAALVVEEGNPPCSYVGERIEARNTTSSGAPAAGKLFPKAAISLRGVMGVVDIAGELIPGDRIVVQVYEPEEA